MLHYSCPPLVGGVEEILRHHAQVLHRFGHRICILAGMGEAFNEAFEITIHPLIASQNERVKMAHEACLEGRYGPLKEIEDEIYEIVRDWAVNLDVLIAHNVLHMPFNLPLTLALRRLAFREEVKMVSWAHDSPYVRLDLPEYLTHAPWISLRLPHPRISYVAISDSRRAAFKKYLKGIQWRVIHNGIDPADFFYLSPESVRLFKELNFPERDLVVVQPSRITPRKNLELSLEIIHGIKSLGCNVLFILTGAYDHHEGRAIEYYRLLREKVDDLKLQNNVAILAEYVFKDGTHLVPRRTFIRDLYLMADLLLMTSKDEGFGLPLLEAGMIKLPIACSRIKPFQEIGTDVCFFRLEDPPLFIAGRIMEYLSRTTTHEMYRKVMRQYIWDIVCKREILPFLEELTGETLAVS
ncbi:MAG: glycosyltransferase family 4 protein [Deltaproteobacteria bacterium]|nr:glycosyltransferase family 4 protein [Deltaproteobacteria bacterium]